MSEIEFSTLAAKFRAILQESDAKLEMKNFNPPFDFCVEVGYLEV